MLQLEAKGEKSHEIVYNVLQAYKNVPGDDWKLYMQTLQTNVDDKPEMTLLEIMTSAESKFKALVSNSKWNVPSEVEEKIIALKVKIRTMKKGDRILKKGPKKKENKEKSEKKDLNSMGPHEQAARIKPEEVSQAQWQAMALVQ
jgi:hypothetical protein